MKYDSEAYIRAELLSVLGHRVTMLTKGRNVVTREVSLTDGDAIYRDQSATCSTIDTKSVRTFGGMRVEIPRF